MRTRKPSRSREQYILDSLPTIFKGGEWIEESSNGGEGVSGRGDGDALPAVENYGQALYVTVIGGQKYDASSLADFSRENKSKTFIIGVGRGAESLLRKQAWDVMVLEDEPEIFGKNARKVNVEQVLSFAPDSPLLLVGEGERVKQARAWLKRARWRREVIELP